MMKYENTLKLVLISSFVALSVFASRNEEVTMLVVPREDRVVKVGMEIADRYPTLLLSYKRLGNGAVSLNGWTGSEWVNVSEADYKAGNFFKIGPDSAVIIEGNDGAIPTSIIPPENWCNSAYAITTTEIRPLLHLIGQYYDFKYKDWQKIAKKYDFSMDEVNPEGLNVSWYHKRLSENLKTREAIAIADLKHWMVIHHPQTMQPNEDPVRTEEPVIVAENEPEEMAVNSDVENPLTNSVPEAVVLSAGNAEEAEINISTNAISVAD